MSVKSVQFGVYFILLYLYSLFFSLKIYRNIYLFYTLHTLKPFTHSIIPYTILYTFIKLYTNNNNNINILIILMSVTSNYHITNYSKKKAKENNVSIKPSTNKNKNGKWANKILWQKDKIYSSTRASPEWQKDKNYILNNNICLYYYL